MTGAGSVKTAVWLLSVTYLSDWRLTACNLRLSSASKCLPRRRCATSINFYFRQCRSAPKPVRNSLLRDSHRHDLKRLAVLPAPWLLLLLLLARTVPANDHNLAERLADRMHVCVRRRVHGASRRALRWQAATVYCSQSTCGQFHTDNTHAQLTAIYARSATPSMSMKITIMSRMLHVSQPSIIYLLFIYYVIVHKVQKAEQWTFAQSNNHHDVYKKSNQLLIQYM